LFENIIGNQTIIDQLSHDIRNGGLVQSILFSGPNFGGKLSTALELARAISCKKEDAKWACTCSSCEQNRSLSSPYLQLLGGRYFYPEILACAHAMKRDDRPGTRFGFFRAIQKLSLRFNRHIWEGEEQKYGTALAIIEKLNDLLEPYQPKKNGQKALDDNFPKDLETILKQIHKLEELIPKNGPSARMIRNISYWSYTASSDQAKVVIIERANELNVSASNSLLKILEEPPKNVYFILISERRTAIMPTLLSRLRTFEFKPRIKEQEQEVLEKIFRFSSNSPSSLKDLLSEGNELGDRFIQEKSEKLYSIITDATSEAFSQLKELSQEVKNDYKILKRILSEVSTHFRSLLEQQETSPVAIQVASNLYSDYSKLVTEGERYSVPVSVCLENIYYASKNAWKHLK
jgi:DNA polymerase III delta prime subunit